ncbi:MAG: orotidine 5'-phosphate decarboxylase [Parcubacteria group bacterium]|nr:orotidine 5'-phosphate decarboxylase [Parcubacteria group bacterium]
MSHRPVSRLNPKKHYLQVALNSTLEDAQEIIRQLPISDRIIVEAGTPLIKRYGEEGIRRIRGWYEERLGGNTFMNMVAGTVPDVPVFPYIVADMKTMDRGATEVEIAARGGASAIIALGNAPTETLNSFVEACEARGLDAMIDMMNVEFPLSVLRALKKVPPVVILHRGVDEESLNKEKQIPLYEIRRIKGNFDIMISIAGGDTVREAQRAIFNDADIVVIWKSVFNRAEDTAKLVTDFLKITK